MVGPHDRVLDSAPRTATSLVMKSVLVHAAVAASVCGLALFVWLRTNEGTIAAREQVVVDLHARDLRAVEIGSGDALLKIEPRIDSLGERYAWVTLSRRSER